MPGFLPVPGLELIFGAQVLYCLSHLPSIQIMLFSLILLPSNRIQKDENKKVEVFPNLEGSLYSFIFFNIKDKKLGILLLEASLLEIKGSSGGGSAHL